MNVSIMIGLLKFQTDFVEGAGSKTRFFRPKCGTRLLYITSDYVDSKLSFWLLYFLILPRTFHTDFEGT